LLGKEVSNGCLVYRGMSFEVYLDLHSLQHFSFVKFSEQRITHVATHVHMFRFADLLPASNSTEHITPSTITTVSY